MPTRPLTYSSSEPKRASSREEQDSVSDVEATVLAVVPQYQVVKVQTREGFQYSLTRFTRVTRNARDVELSDLHEGQRVLCTVTQKLSRVLAAKVLA